MKKVIRGKARPRGAPGVRVQTAALSSLISDVRNLVLAARQSVATAVSTLQVRNNFEIGRRIVEHEQQGAKRAAYGGELLKELSALLTAEFGKGFSVSSLQFMRQFYLEYRSRIQQTVSGELAVTEKHQTLSGKSGPQFTLSWSHYVLLLTLKDADERSFYEIESAVGGWSLRACSKATGGKLHHRHPAVQAQEGRRGRTDVA